MKIKTKNSPNKKKKKVTHFVQVIYIFFLKGGCNSIFSFKI